MTVITFGPQDCKTMMFAVEQCLVGHSSDGNYLVQGEHRLPNGELELFRQPSINTPVFTERVLKPEAGLK